MIMFCVYLIEIMNNDCYVFSSSNRRYEKCVSDMMMILLQ